MPRHRCNAKIIRARLSDLKPTPAVLVCRHVRENGREFCGRPDQHPYELFLQLEDIAHRTARVKRPQSNGIVERLHRTLLDEHFRVEGRRT